MEEKRQAYVPGVFSYGEMRGWDSKAGVLPLNKILLDILTKRREFFF
jgi:hypothetical protein